MTGLTRREALEGVAALAAARWTAEGYDPADVAEWRDLGSDDFRTIELDAQGGRGSAEMPFSRVEVNAGNVDEHTAYVRYDDYNDVSIEIAHESNDVYLGMLTHFDERGPRALAAAIYQAAGELERRREADR